MKHFQGGMGKLAMDISSMNANPFFHMNNSQGGQFTFQSLQALGCDSVNAPFGCGTGKPERVVYNYDQVSRLL